MKKATGIDALALEMSVHAAARTRETLSAKWSEIDLEKKLWTIPAERMKGSKDKKLEDRAIIIRPWKKLIAL